MNKPKTIDEILLRPAYWKLDDWIKAKRNLHEMFEYVIGDDHISNGSDMDDTITIMINNMKLVQRQRLAELEASE